MAAEMEEALAEIVALDQTHGEQLDALGVLLLRTESVASSKIELVEAGVDDELGDLGMRIARAAARYRASRWVTLR